MPRLAALCLASILLVGCDSTDADAVVANNDTVQISPGETVTIDVLANDVGEGLRIDRFQARSLNRGTVTETEDGRLRYRPNAGFLGMDSFTYGAISTGGTVSKNAIVTITVR